MCNLSTIGVGKVKAVWAGVQSKAQPLHSASQTEVIDLFTCPRPVTKRFLLADSK